MIANYTYYTGVYRGIVISSETAYTYYAERATDELNAYPIGLVTDQDALKKCQCRIADILSDAAKKMNVSGENVNGYYTVNYSVLTDEQVRKQIANAVALYIGRFIQFGSRKIVF